MANSSRYRVCVVGLGPSGLGAALTLAKLGVGPELVCLDQGGSYSNRTCALLLGGACKGETPCQIICGFGGSLLLSGGKISAFPAGSGLAAILGDDGKASRKVEDAINTLRAFVPLEKPDIEQTKIDMSKELFENMGFAYKYFDVYHFHHDQLGKACEKIHSQLQSARVSVLLNSKLMDVDQEKRGFRVKVKQDGEELTILTEFLILGLGRSGKSILELMNTHLGLGGKRGQLDVGVRLEFPTHLLPPSAWYHGDLKLLFENARTFCVCKDGSIAPYVIDGVFFTEGRFTPRNRSGLTNLGIIKRYEPSDRNKILLQHIRERSIRQRNGRLVCESLTGYLDSTATVAKTSTPERTSDSFWVWGDVKSAFPASVSTEIREAVMYFAQRLIPRQHWERVKVFAPEVDYAGISFPVKPNFSIRPGLYIIGDCVGDFRGIAQAFCSGIICAESLVGDSYE
jgi:uncharacterized FAD-dependent dehydrogenase